MLNLDLYTAPRWLELVPGVRVQVLPLGTSLLRDVWADPDLEGHAGADSVPPVLFAKAIARRAVVGWDGVGDAAGEALAVSAERIDALLEVPPLYVAFRRDYITPGLTAVAEGNGSAPSPSGTSAAAQPIATPAEPAAPSAPEN